MLKHSSHSLLSSEDFRFISLFFALLVVSSLQFRPLKTIVIDPISDCDLIKNISKNRILPW